MGLGRRAQVPILGGDCDHLVMWRSRNNTTPPDLDRGNFYDMLGLRQIEGAPSPHGLQQFLFPYFFHHP